MSYVLMEPTSSNCSLQPSIVFLILTLVVTLAATATLCVAIMTKHWEYVTWEKEKLEILEKNITNGSSNMKNYGLEWLIDNHVARLVLENKESIKHSNSKGQNKDLEKNLPALFFVPIHGGIWSFCITLAAEQQTLLKKMGFPQILCTNYLRMDTIKEGNSKTHWQNRMQNLSISCALVCLIILGSSALIGTFGVTKRQISAVLVTGVMYLLAAIFAIFSLTIIHFKRAKSKNDCLSISHISIQAIEGVVISSSAEGKPYNLSKVYKYFDGRVFTTGWSLKLGWGGAGMCVLVSTLWILLSKIMRINPLNAMMLIL